MKRGMIPAKNVDAYLKPLSPDKRAALQRLRKTIKAAMPGAVECISYGLPAYRLNGKMLVAFGAAAKHCSFYPGAHPVAAHREELAAYSTSKGTVRFAVDRPLPATLVRKLIRTRIAERAPARRAS